MESVQTEKPKRKRSKRKALAHIAAFKVAAARALKSEWFFNRVISNEPESKRDMRGTILVKALDTVKNWDAVLKSASEARERAGKVVRDLTGELGTASAEDTVVELPAV
jgi:hypothetical protein